MCGIIGLLLADENQFVNQLLVDGLTVLQHRGQDAAGMVTAERRRLHLRKDNGLVRDVFHTHHMMELRGNVGIGHCRYPTAGSSSCAEAQPLYTNYPYGICVAHNGNITNTQELTEYLQDTVGRHVNTESDSELLLNLFAEALTKQEKGISTTDQIFKAIAEVMGKCIGGYAGLYLINGIGLVSFRDPHGIRPLVFGCRKTGSSAKNGNTVPASPARMGSDPQVDYVVASESVAIDTLGFDLVRDIKPGEAIFLDMNTGQCHSRVCHPNPTYTPCIFEYVYFARPDSIMDKVSVYESRLKMGEKLAEKIIRLYPDHGIDVVVPIPDTSRTCALQAAYRLNRPFREGFIKNRYIARTFIMPGQETRKKSVRLKLNTIKSEFAGKNVLLVDDSIVRGTTGHEIVQMARDAGAKKVFFTSAAPPIRFPNIYGVDIPTREELIAYNRDEVEIAAKLGSDWVVYQDLADLEDSVKCLLPPGHSLKDFDTSCFSGTYVTGQKIGDEYFEKLYNKRNDKAKQMRESRSSSVLSSASSLSLTRMAMQSNDGAEAISNDKRSGYSSDDGCESLTNKTGKAR
ncbi:Amidophosphoribosyltransferase, chloroplastic (Fragment) [Seminavis robusta]|uniref:Amidophosphoribosyltransferase n=1 Tax=Seminavis robusta TaxID=568900 RepID=A0A9N8EXZ5_9STRA